MKEKGSAGYEYYANSVPRSLEVGAVCLGKLIEPIYREMKPIIEYRIKDAISVRQRTTWQDLRKRGMI